MNDIELHQYELMVILPPDMNDQDLQKRVQELRTLLQENKGKILHEDIVGVRDFAYRIKKHDRGFYAVFHFEHDPSFVPELEKTIRIETPVIRHLLMAAPRHYFFKPIKEYEQEAEAARLVEEQEKKTEPSRQKRSMQRAEKPAQPRPTEKIPASEPAPEVAPPTEQDMKKKLKVEEEKLQNLLDNPDIKI